MDFNELIFRLGQTILQRRRLFLSILTVCVLAVIVGSYIKSQKFESNATIFISLGSPRLNTSQSEERNQIAVLQSEEFVASQVELMKTNSLREELIDTLPPWVFEKKPSSKWYIRFIVTIVRGVLDGADAVLVGLRLTEPKNLRFEKLKLIEDGLTIFPVRKSQVIELSFISKKPQVPKIVLDTFIKIYKVRLAELRAKSEGAKIYLSQAGKLSRELEQSESALTSFMLEKGVADIRAEKAQILVRLDNVASLARTPLAQRSDSTALEFTITGPNAPPQILQKSTELNKLLSEKIRLSASFTDNQRDVLRLDSQIASLKADLNKELLALAQVIKRDRVRLEYLLRIEPRYNWLARQVRVLSASYETYSTAAKDRETFFDRDNQILTQVIDAPAVPYHPMKPTRLTLILLGLVFALFLALVVVLVVEWVHQIGLAYKDQPETEKKSVPLKPVGNPPASVKTIRNIGE